MIYKLNKIDPEQIYHLMAQTIIPRPIAWIVTQDKDIINIAPFSFFTPLSSKPATVIVSIGHKENGDLKDTLANIKKNKKCTICMVDEYHLEKMHFSSKALPSNQSESEAFDITTKELLKDFPPMIQNASVAYCCTFNQIVDLGDARTIPVILNVKNIYVDDKTIENDKHLKIHFNPVARVAREYAFLSKRIKAPTIPKVL